MTATRRTARCRTLGAARQHVLKQPSLNDWIQLRNQLALLGTQIYDLQWMFKNLITRMTIYRRKK